MMHLNAFLQGIGQHEAAWRHPRSTPLDALSVEHYAHLAQLAEAGRFDSLFLADAIGVIGPVERFSRSFLEPVTLLSAIAAVTRHIGLISTASTTYTEPFNLARAFASLDHISHGRAGWNIVTSGEYEEAANFGDRPRPGHEERYARAAEFVDVAKKLWDSWSDDALVLDKDAGIFADPARVRPVDHKGAHFAVRGPLNVPRSPQGWPLLVQAGSSPTGRTLAASVADAVFTTQRSLPEAQAFYQDVKARVARAGRRPEDVAILPGLSPVVGRTRARAQALAAELEALTSAEHGVRQLSVLLDFDLTGHPLDGPLPDVGPGTEGGQSRFDMIVTMARRDDLTIRQLAARFAASRGHHLVVGTPTEIADEMAAWFEGGGADGFNLMPLLLPESLADFVELVVPELQRRGLFRTEYTATTLRGHYGLPRPAAVRAVPA